MASSTFSSFTMENCNGEKKICLGKEVNKHVTSSLKESSVQRKISAVPRAKHRSVHFPPTHTLSEFLGSPCRRTWIPTIALAPFSLFSTHFPSHLYSVSSVFVFCFFFPNLCVYWNHNHCDSIVNKALSQWSSPRPALLASILSSDFL